MSAHSTPLLKTFPWLSISFRVKARVLIIIAHRAPHYLILHFTLPHVLQLLPHLMCISDVTLPDGPGTHQRHSSLRVVSIIVPAA
jgi:hypothetical protein